MKQNSIDESDFALYLVAVITGGLQKKNIIPFNIG